MKKCTESVKCNTRSHIYRRRPTSARPWLAYFLIYYFFRFYRNRDRDKYYLRILIYMFLREFWRFLCEMMSITARFSAAWLLRLMEEFQKMYRKIICTWVEVKCGNRVVGGIRWICYRGGKFCHVTCCYVVEGKKVIKTFGDRSLYEFCRCVVTYFEIRDDGLTTLV
jgi:hypothetical protein